MTIGGRDRSIFLPRATERSGRRRSARAKAARARSRRLAGRAFRLSARRLRERTSGGEEDRSSRTTSTGKSEVEKVASRTPSQDAISRRSAGVVAGKTRAAETATAGSLACGRLVGRGAVDRRQRHVVGAEVHGELPAVMDQVIQEYAPENARLGHFVGRPTPGDRQPFPQVFVGLAGDRRAARGDVLVESGEKLRDRVVRDPPPRPSLE